MADEIVDLSRVILTREDRTTGNTVEFDCEDAAFAFWHDFVAEALEAWLAKSGAKVMPEEFKGMLGMVLSEIAPNTGEVWDGAIKHDTRKNTFHEGRADN